MQNGSLLIFGGTPELRKDKVKEILNEISPKFANKHPDLLIVETVKDKSSIGIDQVRDITKFLTIKPYNLKNKVVVVFDAHKLTVQAQNALLKTLEEPPEFAVIILETKSEESLLPTVVSRCKKIAIKETHEKNNMLTEAKELIDILAETNLGNRLELVEKLSKKEREEIIFMLENWVIYEREKMLATGSNMHAKNIEKIIEIKGDLENTNVNMRLALEILVLELK